MVTAFRDGRVTLRENRRTDGFTFAMKEIGYQGVRVGDLVIHSMDGFAGAIGVSESTGKCSPVCVVCRPRPNVEARFHAYVLRHMAVSGYITSLAKGIRERSTSFGWGEFSEQVLPLPPMSKQKAIADFLDRKTAAIDALIEKKQRLLDLLAEKRSVLINQAVTKGMNPDVPRKDSGIPWIGEIPAHWEIRRLRFLCDITTGSRDTQDAQDHGEFPFFVRSQTVERISTWSFDGEGVLTAGDGAGVGKVFHHHIGKKEVHQRVYLLHRFRGVLGRYLYWFIRENFYKVVLDGAAKSTVDSLRRPMFQNFWIAFGSPEEQRSIALHVDRISESMDAVAEKLAGQIDRLHEYRQALITAAVTGQLDVTKESAA